MSESQHNPHIRITSGTMLRFLLIAVLILVLYYISDVLLVVLAAVIIASAVEPIIRRLKRYHFHRVIGAITVYLISAAVVAAVLIFVMPTVINDVASVINNAPQTISLGELWSPLSNMGGGASSLANRTISIYDFVNGLRSFFSGGAGVGALQTANMLFGGFLSFILIIVLSFYLSMKEEGVDEFLRIVMPVRHHDYIIDLWHRSQYKIGYWLRGQVILGLIIGVMVYVTLLIMGIQHALVLACLAAVFEVIMPVFGPIISSIPAILLAFSVNGVGTAALLVCLFIIIYQLESQLIYPLVVKRVVGVSPIVVILALVIGAKLAGVLGALIAVPLSAAFMEYIYDIEKRKKSERASSIQG